MRLLYYMYRDDQAGELVYAAMERALDRGVAVSLLIDGFGAYTPDQYFTPLVDKGLTYCRFHPTSAAATSSAATRSWPWPMTSRVLIGGFNVEDGYFGDGRRGRLARPWPDGRRPGRGAAGALL